MIELTLQVYMLTPENSELSELDESLKFEESECELIEHTFYHIDILYPFNERYCIVVVAGNEYQVNQSYAAVKQLIKEQLTYKWN